MNNDQKIDFIYATVFEMAPEVKHLAQSLRAMEHRIRAAELKIEQHDVQVDRLMHDMDSIGKKVRYDITENKLKSPENGESRFIIFMSSVLQSPHFWPLLLSGFMFLMSILGVAVRFLVKLPPPVPVTLNLENKR